MSITANPKFILPHTQYKAIYNLILNSDKQVILYAPPKYNKFVTLVYFLYISISKNEKDSVCIMYNNLTFLKEFKDQLSQYFDNFDNFVFTYKTQYCPQKNKHYMFIISTFPIETLYATNIIISENTQFDNKIKVICMKTGDEIINNN